MLALLQHYELISVSLIVQNTSKWRAMADLLERHAGQTHNITIHHKIYFEDNRLCCALRHTCCYVAWPYDIFEKIKSSSKGIFAISTATCSKSC